MSSRALNSIAESVSIMGELRPQLDTILDCLAARRRRDVLRILHDDPSLPLGELAEEVAVREYAAPIEELPAKAVERIALSLDHNHLRKLEAAGLVEYSGPRDPVTADDALEQAVQILALIDQAGPEGI